jgi:hypothetical protein
LPYKETDVQVVVETPSYLADAEPLFTIKEREAIIDQVAVDPAAEW